MNATVIAFTAAHRWCSARTKTDILVVFQPPTDAQIDLGDVLEVDLFALDRSQQIENLTKKRRITAEVRSHDLHDLRLPMAHGTSRFPSDERRKEA